MTMSCDAVMTRSVWSYNLEAEFELIRRVIGLFPFISMDIEFPGVIFQSHPTLRQPQNNYAVMKANVDCMHLIQVGLTFSDYHGNLPTFGTSHHFIWEFNFCEFDVTCHPHAPHSVTLLQRQGMDFHKNRNLGVNIVQFVELMMISGLLCNSHIRWITFHGAYDFAYMIKEIYDVKHLVRFCPNLHGCLDRVSESLGLDNSARKSHHAGSDSLVTLHVFNEIKKLYFHTQNDLKKYAGVVYGLEML
ncbi:CCR4-NOT transcription complex subunit 7/8 [Vigna unguiculata]|uniref:poly(A)-specific ribonuclease n=1 Tax=Vigna unguiculata TaxID=3917 RepID=A0A4D6NDJ1_VIGUN|nr:CCR4-NOT transcription complex subunit 7/8 [Vigna unguiculata]